jgi:hypothetical protein
MNQIYNILYSIQRIFSLPGTIRSTARTIKHETENVSKMIKPKDKEQKPEDKK